MDLESMARFAQEYLLPHWPFIVMAFILGSIGQVMKTRIWTKEAAAKSKFFWYARATLPFHAMFAGGASALAATLAFGSVPVSPGVEGTAAAMLYYAGAGAASSWLFGAFKYFLKQRGIDLPTTSMPPKPSSDPPPDEKSADRDTPDNSGA